MKELHFNRLFYGLIAILLILVALCVTGFVFAARLNSQLKSEENKNKDLSSRLTGLQKQFDTLKAEHTSENSGEKIAYLTFDDGPSGITQQLLDKLDENKVHATFFVIGLNCQKHPDMVKKMIADGNVVGVHSWTHQYPYIYANMKNFQDDFTKLRDYLIQQTGSDPKICRFPGGTNNTVSLHYGGHIMRQVVTYVQGLGYKPFDWNVDAKAATTPEPSSTAIYNNVIDGCKNKKTAIILFHDADKNASTLQALPQIIAQLRQMGFTFSTLSADSKEIMFKPV